MILRLAAERFGAPASMLPGGGPCLVGQNCRRGERGGGRPAVLEDRLRATSRLGLLWGRSEGGGGRRRKRRRGTRGGGTVLEDRLRATSRRQLPGRAARRQAASRCGFLAAWKRRSSDGSGVHVYDESGLRFTGCRRLRDATTTTTTTTTTQAQGMIGAIRSIDPRWMGGGGGTSMTGRERPAFHTMPLILGGPTFCTTGSAFLILKFYIPILNSINQWSG